jgi:aquaporin Z
MDAARLRTLLAEALGTAVLVFFAVGVATLSFGFKVAGTSNSAGVVATALAFGLVLMALAYAFGPISGCHVNPAVTLGFFLSKRIPLVDAIGYWVAQLVGAIAGAALLFGLFNLVPGYSRHLQGLGTNGWGANSMIHAKVGAAIIAEIVLTFLFVFVILVVTRGTSGAAVAGLVIGLTLSIVHLIGIPIDGTSVNPARSLGPALFVGGSALSQLWVFIIFPMVGGALAAVVFAVLYPEGGERAKREEDEPAQAA